MFVVIFKSIYDCELCATQTKSYSAPGVHLSFKMIVETIQASTCYIRYVEAMLAHTPPMARVGSSICRLDPLV